MGKGNVYISSGYSGGRYGTFDVWRRYVAIVPEHPGIAEGYARLAANPLKPTAIVLESRRREEENKRRGGRTGYDW